MSDHLRPETSDSRAVLGLKLAPTIFSERQCIPEDYGTDIARLEGRGFEYLLRQKRTVIGKNSSRGEVDVNLGPSTFISRKHIEIFFEYPEFYVLCVGKTGVYVDGFYQRKGDASLKLPKT